jgi:hypothetical protein
MQASGSRESNELPGYLGGAAMLVLLALAAESLSEGNALAAIVLTVIAISCFYFGANRLVEGLERENDIPG